MYVQLHISHVLVLDNDFELNLSLYQILKPGEVVLVSGFPGTFLCISSHSLKIFLFFKMLYDMN